MGQILPFERGGDDDGSEVYCGGLLAGAVSPFTRVERCLDAEL
jgi:hypothetical protein